jgi:hypothetical protein
MPKVSPPKFIGQDSGNLVFSFHLPFPSPPWRETGPPKEAAASFHASGFAFGHIA